MKKINNKGFTLVEVIAVVAIITILSIILIPNVTKLINKEKSDAENSIKDTILVATKTFVTDNKYNIVYNNKETGDIDTIDSVKADAINVYGVLINRGYITATYKDIGIVNPSDKKKCLSKDAFVIVTAETEKDGENTKIKKFNYEVKNIKFVHCSEL